MQNGDDACASHARSSAHVAAKPSRPRQISPPVRVNGWRRPAAAADAARPRRTRRARVRTTPSRGRRGRRRRRRRATAASRSTPTSRIEAWRRRAASNSVAQRAAARRRRRSLRRRRSRALAPHDGGSSSPQPWCARVPRPAQPTAFCAARAILGRAPPAQRRNSAAGAPQKIPAAHPTSCRGRGHPAHLRSSTTSVTIQDSFVGKFMASTRNLILSDCEEFRRREGEEGDREEKRTLLGLVRGETVVSMFAAARRKPVTFAEGEPHPARPARSPDRRPAGLRRAAPYPWCCGAAAGQRPPRRRAPPPPRNGAVLRHQLSALSAKFPPGSPRPTARVPSAQALHARRTDSAASRHP